MIEDDVFKIIIPTSSLVTEQVTEQVTGIDQEQTRQVLSFCREPRSLKEIMDFLGFKHREHFRSKILKPLIKQKKLFLLFPDKPKSSKQKYYSGE